MLENSKQQSGAGEAERKTGIYESKEASQHRSVQEDEERKRVSIIYL